MLMLYFVDIGVTVNIGVRMLTVSIRLPESLKGKPRGLLGDADGDPNNDFILPTGTVLPVNGTQVNTERKIFNNFGQLCKYLYHVCF